MKSYESIQCGQFLAGEGGRIVRQMSSDSMSSINSLSSACSVASQQSAATDGDIGKNSKKNKKKGWVSEAYKNISQLLIVYFQQSLTPDI